MLKNALSAPISPELMDGFEAEFHIYIYIHI